MMMTLNKVQRHVQHGGLGGYTVECPFKQLLAAD
jgi:hypothetical protein